MSLIPNATLAKLRAGKTAIGFGVNHSRSVATPMMAKTAGYDWLFIDMEHGAFSVNEAAQLCIASLPTGLTPIALELADDFIQIPMVGFTESLNISVSAAILIQSLTGRLRHSKIPWQLNDGEQSEILLNWLQNSIKRSDVLIRDYLKKHG